MPALSPLIGPVTSTSRVDEVVQRISEAIHLGLLDDGEQLPVEVELARQFGVAPMTVREALAELRERDLVETRRGRSGGSFVTSTGGATGGVPARAVGRDDRLGVARPRRRAPGRRGPGRLARRAARVGGQRATPVCAHRAARSGDLARRADPGRLPLPHRGGGRLAVRAAHASRGRPPGRTLRPAVAADRIAVDHDQMVSEHHAIATAVKSEDAETARRLAQAHVDGNLRRLISLNLMLNDEGSGPEPALASAATPMAELVSSVIGPLFESLERLATEIVARGEVSGPGPWSARALTSLEAAVAARLAAHPAMVGAGFVAAPGAVAGEDRFMAWWQRAGEELARLRLNFEASSVDIYDYLQMAWFQQAQAGGARNAFGPHVDYAGSGLYVVTATVPVVADGRFVGIAGSDVVMTVLERHLVAILRRGATESVVVNEERRVIAANSPRWVVGSRLPTQPHAGNGEFVEVAEVPSGPGWIVAVTDRPLRP